ncbi:unnamed protein product [Angiostrongylus costaricensis]|uniref:WW domain-containing protein n=1 Tax=Angiostrongylus costaricensis TaxID=334426 RepID=A0A0R3PR61_ANGCS|nr:unnamed protein product [Angiostrongylus costaricensis]
MTFANSIDNSRRRLATTNGVKQTPSAPPTPTQLRQPLGPKNSLEYWKNSVDQRGVTYFWNSPANPYYGIESIYAQQKPTSWRSGRRPAPFPLQIPPQPPLNKPRTQVTIMSQGIYQNVANSTTIQKPTEMMNTTSAIANGNLNSPSDAAYALKRPQPLIWSAQTEPLKELRALPSVTPSSGEKRSARQKPRWGRFMQSLCCCVTPHIENGS